MPSNLPDNLYATAGVVRALTYMTRGNKGRHACINNIHREGWHGQRGEKVRPARSRKTSYRFFVYFCGIHFDSPTFGRASGPIADRIFAKGRIAADLSRRAF